MLINPLKNETSSENKEHNVRKVDAISEIIAYLINNYSEYLSDVDLNRKFVENIIREKVYSDYSNLNTDSTISDILDFLVIIFYKNI